MAAYCFWSMSKAEAEYGHKRPLRSRSSIRPVKPYKQQLSEAKSKRTGVADQKPVSPSSRAKRRRVVLRAFLPAMLGWPEAQWQTAGNYLDEETAMRRADALAKSSWFYRYATSWAIDGEPYTPRTLDIVEPTTRPTR